MKNLLESNERTLVIFDSVCSGLSACLALVHADIKQMTEHRNKLALLEQEQIQAKLIPAQDLLSSSESRRARNDSSTDERPHSDTKSRKSRRKIEKGEAPHVEMENEDPHHLAGLKLLDKRLADSFSHALSLNDLQKSSIAAKQQAISARPSIFQVLLGKSSKQGNNHAKKIDKIEESAKADNKTIIDDINNQTRLAMQYAKQLEVHLFKVEDLRSKYEMHLKMGLVVKSVARAYLGDGQSNSPNSLARSRHCSSMVINESSGSFGTHSSLSSLNLSTWSSSRSKAHKKHREVANNCSKSSNNDQMFVSTISLNNKHSKRINLAKLISAPSNGKTKFQNNETHYMDPHPVSNSSRRHTSHSFEAASTNSAYGYTDWSIPDLSYGQINDEKHLSKPSNDSTVGRVKGNKAKNHQTASSKTTIKDFIENIDRIEAELESFMGSFLLAIEDIQGFARVCQGDVFEISIKYGDSQKFKTRISVLKDNRQKCDNRQTVFKARVADVLAVKAYECKGLGKRVLLGHKLCETRDLFTARSQLMTISLNQTGSIKLNLIVTWNPLHLAPNSLSTTPGVDIAHISLPPTPVSSSTLSSLSSGPSINGITTTISIQSQHSKLPASETQRQERNESLYQNVCPTYGYYIPPPDYLTNELKC